MISVHGLVALIVEDHDFQRHTVARMLRQLGVQEILEARDGKEALDLLRDSAQVGLVLCDLDMPEMDGMEFLRHLGQAHSMASVIICSAQEKSLLVSVEKMASAYGVQLLGVIEKPVTLSVLDQLILRMKPNKLPLPISSTDGSEFDLEQILQGLQRNQFEPFFQPKLEVVTGQVVGAEALARWQHPEHGLIYPVAFIQILEQNGRMEELTYAMLEKAARACCGWRAGGLNLNVSVNLSFVSLGDTRIADRITKVVLAAGLDPHQMILEITETAAMTEVAPALENLTRLRMRGFGLSVDDYGTGFSSLRQLTRVPFTELKIDQSFVFDCAINSSSRTIVESSVNMARRLGIKSVAEGVENQADWEALKLLGCDIAQGYFFAKPLNKSDFLTFCAN